MLVRSATKSSQPTCRLEKRIYGRSHSPCDRPPSKWHPAFPAPEVWIDNQFTSMDAAHEPTIFNIDQLRAALELLDLNEVAIRTLELAEDYMPGAAWLDRQGKVHIAETMSQVDGLVLCQATEVDPDSPDEVPFWVASWLDELFPDIAKRLRTALAEAIWGSGSAPEVD